MSEGQKTKKKSIEGKIIISGRAPPFDGATAHICLEDISYQDSESIPIAQTAITEISHGQNETIISFSLPIENPSMINEKNDYAVSVWIDLDSDGRSGKGDLFNDENYMVLTHGFGRIVEIKIS